MSNGMHGAYSKMLGASWNKLPACHLHCFLNFTDLHVKVRWTRLVTRRRWISCCPLIRGNFSPKSSNENFTLYLRLFFSLVLWPIYLTGSCMGVCTYMAWYSCGAQKMFRLPHNFELKFFDSGLYFVQYENNFKNPLFRVGSGSGYND